MKIVNNHSKFSSILDENKDKLSEKSIAIFTQMHKQFKRYTEQVESYKNQVEQDAQQNVMYRAIIKIEGIGPITASAVVATVGNAKAFKNGRQMAAWLGLVPRQHSSGNNTKLTGITKRGDGYVRKLLIHGARSVVNVCEKKTDRKNKWIADKKIE